MPTRLSEAQRVAFLAFLLTLERDSDKARAVSLTLLAGSNNLIDRAHDAASVAGASRYYDMSYFIDDLARVAQKAGIR